VCARINGEKLGMTTPVLKVENLSKKFCRNLKRSLWYGLKDLGAEVLRSRTERKFLRRDEFWALQGVNMELARGEMLGLVGHNGAGKSTLLKAINGLIRPDVGRISIWGRIGALIELGAGFNPILSGRENIYISAAVLGLSSKEINRRLDEIIEFAEIGDFIDAPLQTYSSGMKVRLGFAVASSLNPDVLLVDEVLSVGDASFRERSYARLMDYKRRGGSIIFVSHNSAAVETNCDRVMLLDHGQMLNIGAPFEIVQQYESLTQKRTQQASTQKTPTASDADVIISDVHFRDLQGSPRSEFAFGEALQICFSFESKADVKDPDLRVSIRKGEGDQAVLSTNSTRWDGLQIENLSERGTICCTIQNQSLSPGVYYVVIGVQNEDTAYAGKKWYSPPMQYNSFTINAGDLQEQLPGIKAYWLISGVPPLVMAHQWELNATPLSNVQTAEQNGLINQEIK
jgi:lipopolysaccharide transport system ATP-binding protein